MGDRNGVQGRQSHAIIHNNAGSFFKVPVAVGLGKNITAHISTDLVPSAFGAKKITTHIKGLFLDMDLTEQDQINTKVAGHGQLPITIIRDESDHATFRVVRQF